MLCPICEKNEVKNEERDCCVICHLTGRQFESFLLAEDRSNVLTKIRALPKVTQASVWHFGAGLFQLGVMLDDGRLVVPGFPIDTGTGEIVVQPGIPRLIDGWGVAITDDRQEGVTMLARAYDDEELVAVIGRIADNQLEATDVPQMVI